MSKATDKQVDYILSLAGVRFLSQVPGLSQRQAHGGLTSTEASLIIEEMVAAKESADEPVKPLTEGAMPAAAVLDVLGRWVTLTTAKVPEPRAMLVSRVERHAKTGNVVLVGEDKSGRSLVIAVQNVTSWLAE